MSEKHLYEKHLAERLQELPPPPDMHKHWLEMKALLDEDMPRGGAFGRNGRWWRLGVIAGILLIGGWITGTQFRFSDPPGKSAVAQKPNTAQVRTNPSQRGAASPKADGTMPANDQAKPQKEGSLPATQQDNPVAALPGNVSGRDQADAVVNNFPENKRNRQPDISGEKKSTGDIKSAATAATGTRMKPVKDQDSDNGSYTTNRPDNRDVTGSGTTQNNSGNKTKNNNKQYAETVHNDILADKNEDGRSVKPERKFVKYSPVREQPDFTGSISPAPAENLTTDFSLLDLKVPATRNSTSARSGRSRLAGSFAFGLSLPLAFPLGDQKALGYNYNAGANTVSDYIPAPHIQYHFNDKTYLQTELQFMTPQFIRPILLYQHKTPQAGNYYIYNSVYARKLYYFNLPIGIHHSPFPNFYLGTGLQFSSLLSGVALYEETKRNMNGQQTALLDERYTRLSGDSLSNRMNTSEVRLMLEMNYYFNRFTVGLRYNQAFNNYVSFQIDNTAPYTFDKNKALQFYLRYNLWEDIKRKNKGKGLLSSK